MLNFVGMVWCYYFGDATPAIQLIADILVYLFLHHMLCPILYYPLMHDHVNQFVAPVSMHEIE